MLHHSYCPKVSKIGYGTKIFLLCAKKIAQTIATVIRAPEGSKDMYRHKISCLE